MLLEIFSPSSYFLNPYALPSLTAGFYCFLLGIFVWARNKKILGFSLFTLTFPCGMWIISVGMGLLSSKPEVAYIWYKLCYFWVATISAGSLYFCLQMTRMIKIKRERVFLVFGYIVMTPFAFISLFTDLLVKSPPHKFYWGYEGNAGYLLLPFLCAWCVWAFKASYNVYLTYKSSLTSLEKKKFRIFFYTYFFGYFAVVDYAGDFGIGIYPAGYIFIAIYISLLAYNMVRYRAFEIDTVIHRTILWLLTSSYIFVPMTLFLYLCRPLLSKTPVVPLGIIMTLLFFTFEYYRRIIQPRIDNFFRRRKYDYQTILGKVAEKIATTINIEDLARQLLAEICETMYLRNSMLYVLTKDGKSYSLVGRRGYRELDGMKQRDALEIYTVEEKSKLPVNLREFNCNSLFGKWLTEHQDILEKDLVEFDPGYKQIKGEAIDWFKEREIELIIPIVLENKVNALLGLGKKENFQAYNMKDLELLRKLGQEVGVTIFNALHYEELAQKERMDEEMKMGRQIQTELLPRVFPEVAGLTVQGLMQPASEIGGDYYDFITLPGKDQLSIVIGDVSGKGVAAGLLMAMVKATIHTLSQDGVAPKRLLLRVNQMLYQNIGGHKFMTLLYFVWQAKTRTFTYSSAGHEHILICRKQGSSIAGETAASSNVETILSGGFMLGMVADIETYLEEKQIEVQPQDKILLYTDGVTEAQDHAGERFGLNRLKAAFQEHSQKPARELMQAIKDDVYFFIGTHPQYDDITLVVLEAQ